MSGQYKRVNPDGADWRCDECQILYPANKVIAGINTETQKCESIICLECVDEEWFKAAKCVGSI